MYEKIGLQFVKRKVFSIIVVELIIITKDEKLLAVTYVGCVFSMPSPF